MNQIIPAILAKTEDEFRSKLAAIEGAAPLVQIDVMDGAFVPNESWFDPTVVKSIKTYTKFELHLMVNDPKKILEACIDWTQLVRVIWHVEAPVDQAELIAWAKGRGWQVGLAINPATPSSTIDPFAETLDEILVMGNAPGFSGKELMDEAVARAEEFHATWPPLAIGFDIGVNAKTIPRLVEAGVERLCAASSIFGTDDPKQAYQALAAIGAGYETAEG